jgi:hypothetical protein
MTAVSQRDASLGEVKDGATTEAALPERATGREVHHDRPERSAMRLSKAPTAGHALPR